MEAAHPPVTEIVLACDESGAKGYASATDIETDEIGVFAGIMLPRELLPKLKPEFDAAVKRFASSDGKLHITELKPDDQAALRQAIYGLILKHQLPCFYEAMHVAGFNAAHGDLVRLVERARANRRSPIKMSGNPPEPPSLHVTLFEGLYGKVLAYCEERGQTRVDIEVRTDRVDESIRKEFGRGAEKLTDYAPVTSHATGFDPASKQVVRGSVTVKGSGADAELAVTVEKLKLESVGDDDGLVVAADVLANSLVHHFRTRPEDQKYRALNKPDAFAGHPLAVCLDSFRDWSGYSLADEFYRHPKDPALTEDPGAGRAG
jgi:hypothetical protein